MGADARQTIKYEEVYLRAYRGVSEARATIGRYLGFYNGKRPHSNRRENDPLPWPSPPSNTPPECLIRVRGPAPKPPDRFLILLMLGGQTPDQAYVNLATPIPAAA